MHLGQHAHRADGPASRALRVVHTESPRGRVLLVEDQEEMRAFLAELLEHEGYEVLTASNGIEAIAILEREYHTTPLRPRPPIGVVVTDYRMPGATGLEVAEHLRRFDWKPSLILLSAFAEPSLHTEAAHLGVAAVMDKPFSIHELLRTIASLTTST